MKAFLSEDFPLDSNIAVELHHVLAERQPSIDYRCHRPPYRNANERGFGFNVG